MIKPFLRKVSIYRKGSLIVDHKVQTNTDSTGVILSASKALVSGTTTVDINRVGTGSKAIAANVTSGDNAGKQRNIPIKI